MPMQGFDAYTGDGVQGKYEILGDDMQLLTVTLGEGEKLTCEPGSMSFMSNDVQVRPLTPTRTPTKGASKPGCCAHATPRTREYTS